jgi:glycosyltransferase involved in cell wall biosynthesis
MKVLILLFCEYPGGSAAAFHGQRIAMGLTSAGAEAKVLGFHSRGQRSSAMEGTDDRGIAWRTFPVKRHARFIPSYVPLAKSFGKEAALELDELLSRERWDAIIYYGRSWLAAKRFLKITTNHNVPVIPYQVEYHDFAFHLLANGQLTDWAMYRKWILPNSPAIIGISRFWQRWADEQHIPNVIIPAFADVDPNGQPVNRPREANAPFHIVFVGGWGPRELPKTLFAGLERAIDRGVDVRLTFVGDVGKSRTERAALGEFRKRHQLKSRTTFAGWLSGEKLTNQLSQADAFILLREETRETQALFPTRLPEYLALGIPVIVSTAGDLGVYLEHGKSAWLIPPGDAVEELAEAIVHLAANDEERRAIGRGGWEVATGPLAYPKLGRELLSFLRSVVRQPSAQNADETPATYPPPASGVRS